jgi:hypothetical protein
MPPIRLGAQVLRIPDYREEPPDSH